MMPAASASATWTSAVSSMRRPRCSAPGRSEIMSAAQRGLKRGLLIVAVLVLVGIAGFAAVRWLAPSQEQSAGAAGIGGSFQLNNQAGQQVERTKLVVGQGRELRVDLRGCRIRTKTKKNRKRTKMNTSM